LEIARGASLLRDDFEVVLFRGRQSVRYLPYLFGVVVRRLEAMKGCSVLRGKSIRCSRPAGQDIFVQVDGELAGKLPAAMETLPEALTLLAPAEYLHREQAFLAVPACA
jgi:diacylglycerol kinase family enzyme